ncbi:MAG: hypothetical protein QXU06_03630 [Candidatus Bathyarchaeia archaeon]
MIRRLVIGLNAAGLDYAFTGALAASYYGVPRTTMDVDIMVKVPRDGLTKLAAALRGAGIEADGGRIESALKSGFRIVTLRDARSPFNVDIILSRGRLSKRAGTIQGLPTFYQAPEDLVLAKLRMIRATIPKERALKDEDDVRAILRFTKVDMGAIRRRARRDKTLRILRAIMAQKP